MISRVFVTLVGIPVVYALLATGDWSRYLLMLFASLVGQSELYRMFGHPVGERPVPEFLLSALILAAAVFFGERGLLLSMGLAGLVLASVVVFNGLQGNGFKRFSLGVAGLLYLPFCLGFFLLLGQKSGGASIFAVLLLIWALDIGAYLVGCSVRGPKLAPNISPNKTISGAIGGIVASMITAGVLFRFGWFPISIEKVVGLALGIGFFSQVADLFESVMKREAGVKDSGALLGGHGGMLDRLDSVLFVGPLAWLFLGG